ncbi:MAG: hypothetical protein K9L74_02895 [Candidatus Izimaplasma sp.]|nr:hypothetical protein [Candidatus Izimaplasma bacterium]
MKMMLNKIINTEFLTFNEVLKLKVTIVNIFLLVFVVLSIPISSLNNLTLDINILLPLGFFIIIGITFLLTFVNLSRVAMHFSIYNVAGITLYFTAGTNNFYAYILFFVTLTIIIFYQDMVTYLVYGGIITIGGTFYIIQYGISFVGSNSLSTSVSQFTYLVVLIGFYLVFLIQFFISDSIYETMNNEWVKMDKILSKYNDLSVRHLASMLEKHDKEPLYKNTKFQQTVSEISVFINEFFEDEASNITEAVEYYFFIHDKEIEEIMNNKNLTLTTRKYAEQFNKYLMNKNSELVSILFDFATLFKETNEFDEYRYSYNINEIFDDKVDKLLSLAILYKYLKTEITQLDKFGFVKRKLDHSEISEMFESNLFREFISYEQLNFFKDNQELFDEYL